MKNTINNKLRRLPGMLAGLLLLAAAACTPESLRPDYETDDSARSAMTLEFGVSATEVGIRTRAEAGEKDPLADAFKSSEVQSLWVGVFDVKTGDLVGKMHTMKIDYENNGKVESDNGYDPVKNTAKVDILYYDAHPTVRIFGVANYTAVKEGTKYHVMGRQDLDAEPQQLESLLDQVDNMSDLFAISVDIPSADEFQSTLGIPVLMGIMTGDSKGFFTVAESEPGKFSPSNYYDYQNNKHVTNDADIKLVENVFDRLDYKKLEGKEIHLRRLLSQVTVNVVGKNGISLSNIRYRKYNLPSKAVYLQERTMRTDPSDNWPVVTPNVADKFDNGQGYTSDSDVTPLADGQSSFQFYQYENKHWAFEPDLNWMYNPYDPYNTNNYDNYRGREAVRDWTDENPIFTVLSGSGNTGDEYSYNNNASYFEITMDLVDETNNKVAREVTYRIHEGYCCDEYGASFVKHPKDFSCFRNTEYTYTITISGLDHIDVSAETQHNHDNGVPGSEIWTLTNDETIEDSSLKPEQSNHTFSGKILDYVFYYANGDETPIVFGDNPMTVLLTLPGLGEADWKEEWEGRSPLTIDGKALDISETDISGEIAFNTEASSSIEFPEGKYNPKNYRCELYILTDYKYDEAGCKAYKYQKITYLPKDNRDPMGGEVTFELAFANEWDNVATQTNGAVVGHIKEISVPKIELTDVQQDVSPVYTLYLNGEEICSGTDPVELAKVNLFKERKIPGQYTALQTYPVTVVVSDENDNYSDISEEVKFLVYPTNLSWKINQKPDNGIIYEKSYNDELSKFDENKFFNLQVTEDLMTSGNWSNGQYVQTGGNRHCFDINPLYDGVITIVASHTGGSINVDKDDKNYLGRYLIVDDNTTEQLSFASFASTAQQEIKFYVKKGDLPMQISTSNSLRIYSVTYSFNDQPKSNTLTWDFAAAGWKAIAAITGNTEAIIEYDGLRLETDENEFKLTTDDGGPSYFQCYTDQKLSFVVNKPGTVSVTASATSDPVKDDQKSRSVFVQIGENGDPISLKTGETRKGERKPFTHSVENITGPTRIYISTQGGPQNIYSIKYTTD